MEERRKLKRRHIMFYSRIFDRKTGKQLGYLGNLTPEGIMIISEEPIDVDQLISLRIDLPEAVYLQSVLLFEALSRWCIADVDPRFFNTGFELTSILPNDLLLIEQIVKDFEVST